MNEKELTDALVKEFGCNRSEAKRVAEMTAKYVRDTESSKLTDEMQNPDYIVRMLREKPPDTPTEGFEGGVEARWNWWIGMLNPLGNADPYQID